MGVYENVGEVCVRCVWGVIHFEYRIISGQEKRPLRAPSN